MNDDKINAIFIVLIAFCAGFFGIVIAAITKRIEFKPPARIWIIACIINFLASLFIFLGAYLFFQSELLPSVVPNDDWSMLVVAYSLSSIPQLTLGMLLLILNKEVIKLLRRRYGKNLSFEFVGNEELGIKETTKEPVKKQSEPKKVANKLESNKSEV